MEFNVMQATNVAIEYRDSDIVHFTFTYQGVRVKASKKYKNYEDQILKAVDSIYKKIESFPKVLVGFYSVDKYNPDRFSIILETSKRPRVQMYRIDYDRGELKINEMSALTKEQYLLLWSLMHHSGSKEDPSKGIIQNNIDIDICTYLHSKKLIDIIASNNETKFIIKQDTLKRLDMYDNS